MAAYLVLRDDMLGPLAGFGLSAASLVAFSLSRSGDGILDFREVGLVPRPYSLLTVAVECSPHRGVARLAAMATVRATSSLRS